MKTKTISVACFLTIAAGVTRGENKPPYLIHRDGEILAVSNRPAFTVSEPITNSFVYIDGEYVDPPYVVSTSNLAVYINGRTITDYEPWVHKREWYSRRVGITPESVAHSVDSEYKSLVELVKSGGVLKFYWGGQSISGTRDSDGGASVFIELARKAEKGDEQARRALIKEMGLENSLSKVHPDWIQRLAGNTNLEVRATRILEAKRQRDQHEREKRERQEREWREQKEKQDGRTHP